MAERRRKERRARPFRLLLSGGERRIAERRGSIERRVQSVPHRRPRTTDLHTGNRVYTERRQP